ncbi:hypothetical protein JKF63_02116 [Porcisia hertigi]|uniref:Uncharacterized protein n=1 Tax=Porcisia hertigi TaxID=2761500 RepID=A0A836I7L7_9TRYP|nr:hypothetical protein JKF63_02116 [Porcisia hertigi]
MGCSASKNTEAKAGYQAKPTANGTSNGAGAAVNGPRSDNTTAAPSRATGVPTKDTTQGKTNVTSSDLSKEAPSGAARPDADNSRHVDAAGAPGKGPLHTNTDANKANSRDNDSDVVLPAGNWVKTEGTPYYYCAKENLYYHPPSCQFYDPTNSMWYDPEKSEWYCDDASDEEAA